jgi:hypothetical protein
MGQHATFVLSLKHDWIALQRHSAAIAVAAQTLEELDQRQVALFGQPVLSSVEIRQVHVYNAHLELLVRRQQI